MTPKRRAASRAGMISINVALDQELHRRLALAALDEQASMNELIREAVRAALDRRDKAQARKGRR